MRRFSLSRSLARVWVAAFIAAAPGIAAANTQFIGGGYVSDFDGCESYGWTSDQVERVIVRVRPSGLPGNNASISRIGILFGTGMHLFEINDVIDPDDDVLVNYFQMWSGLNESSDVPGSDLGIDYFAPADVDENTTAFRGTAVIGSFDGLEGCSARVGFYVARR